MRTLIKPEHQVGGERIAAVTVRQTLRSLGVKESLDNVGGWRNRLPSFPLADNYAMRLLAPEGDIHGQELRSSNDAVAALAPIIIDGIAGISLIEHSSAIAYVSSCLTDRHLIYVSPQISNLGFAPEDLLGRPDLRLKQIHEEDLGRYDQAMRLSCSGAGKFSCHYRLYDNQGKQRWFHDEATVVCDEAGAPLFIKGIMLDITDKKQMETELAEHRYCLERNVEQRTTQLMKRIAMLEFCNASLCDELSSARLEIATLKQQLRQFMPEQSEV